MSLDNRFAKSCPQAVDSALDAVGCETYAHDSCKMEGSTTLGHGLVVADGARTESAMRENIILLEATTPFFFMLTGGCT